MKIAYIIKSHQYPELLVRLISRLNWDDVDFFIHIDKKSDINPFRNTISKLGQNNIFWVKRERSNWGEYGLVQASLNAIRQILLSNTQYDFICELSGQDYPIKSNSEIHEFLRGYQDFSFLQFAPLPITQEYWNWGSDGGLFRVSRYYFRLFGKLREYPQQYRSISMKNKLLNLFCSLRFRLPRNFPEGLQPFGGGAWYCISYEAAKYVDNFVESRPDLTKFFRFCYIPEEMFFQTVICNAPILQGKLLSDHLHYIPWEKSNSSHPPILTLNDREKILQSDKLFARKFDPQIDVDILNWIDRNILHF